MRVAEPTRSSNSLERTSGDELGLLEKYWCHAFSNARTRIQHLTPREFSLLEYIMRRQDQLLPRAMLLEEVWNYKFVPQTNCVDVHMGSYDARWMSRTNCG
jgi:DNA-binding response OmpR family regulator